MLAELKNGLTSDDERFVIIVQIADYMMPTCLTAASHWRFLNALNFPSSCACLFDVSTCDMREGAVCDYC